MSVVVPETPREAMSDARRPGEGRAPASFPCYPKYKNSGVKWLGEVPAHWNVTPFKRLLEFQNGADHKPIEADDGYPVYGSGGIFAHATDYLYDGESVLFGRKGTVDRPLYVLGKFWTVDTMYWTRIRPGAHGKFCYYAATSIPFQYYSTNTALPSMTQGALGAHAIACPEESEQVAIAAFLDRETAKVDALIAEQGKLIALLKEKRQALISHAVTKGLDPNAPMKDSGVEWLGQVPAHWKVTRLKFLASVQTGVAKGKDYGTAETVSMPYLRVANVQDGHIDLTDVAEITIAASDVDRYLLQAGDVLMNEGGDYDKLGRGAVWSGEINPCIHQNHVFAVRPHAIQSAWLNLITGSDYAQFFFMGQSKQSTNLAFISSTNLMELPVVVPPAHEFAEILEQTDQQTRVTDGLIAHAQRAITLLKERRAALISAAVTGKIDVCNV